MFMFCNFFNEIVNIFLRFILLKLMNINTHLEPFPIKLITKNVNKRKRKKKLSEYLHIILLCHHVLLSKPQMQFYPICQFVNKFISLFFQHNNFIIISFLLVLL
jgi:hypothetical protein